MQMPPPHTMRPAIAGQPAGVNAPPPPGAPDETEGNSDIASMDPGAIAAALLALPPAQLASVMHIVESATNAAQESDPSAQGGPPPAGAPAPPGPAAPPRQ